MVSAVAHAEVSANEALNLFPGEPKYQHAACDHGRPT
jgi:hypothetical protein